jgi:hypothetical protein
MPNQGSRSAFLLGENVWKWRLQSHLDTQSFAKFDVLWIKQFSIWHLVALKKHWLSIMKVL